MIKDLGSINLEAHDKVDDFDCLELYNRNQWSHSKNRLGRRHVEKH